MGQHLRGRLGPAGRAEIARLQLEDGLTERAAAAALSVAPEVANDAIDQDCNGADAAGLLSAVVAFRWREGNTTRVNSLRVTEAPAGATVTVTCAGRRKNCPRTRSFTTSAKGSVSLTRMFRRPLRSGAVVTVTVTAPNTVGRVKRYTIRKGRPPRSQTLCLVPGAATPSRC